MTYALPHQNILHRFSITRFGRRPLTILALSLGLLVGTLPWLSTPVTASEEAVSASLADGVYVFGESPEADAIGSIYMVAEVTAGQVVGGFYQPHSSFDCFYGEVDGTEMALTVIDSYEQTEHPFAVALASPSLVASQSGSAPDLVPDGFHAVPELSEMAAGVLQACRSGL